MTYAGGNVECGNVLMHGPAAPTSVLRYRSGRLSLPRSPAIAAALGPGERDGIWYLIRADVPSSAFNHQRRLLAGEPGHAAKANASHAQ